LTCWELFWFSNNKALACWELFWFSNNKVLTCWELFWFSKNQVWLAENVLLRQKFGAALFLTSWKRSLNN
jgi:hypothetical protein